MPLTFWYPTGLSAFDLSVTSTTQLKSCVGSVAELTAGVAARAKYKANDGKCRELGWVCVPMVVETFGA